eukprot:scaffold14104_cov200-Alexandrium_tamarense.AAC.9
MTLGWRETRGGKYKSQVDRPCRQHCSCCRSLQRSTQWIVSTRCRPLMIARVLFSCLWGAESSLTTSRSPSSKAHHLLHPQTEKTPRDRCSRPLHANPRQATSLCYFVNWSIRCY